VAMRKAMFNTDASGCALVIDVLFVSLQRLELFARVGVEQPVHLHLPCGLRRVRLTPLHAPAP
jgi:hypothetical protein